MSKTYLLILVCVIFSGCMAGSGGDSLKWSNTVTNLSNGDTFDVPKHWKSMIDTVQSIINGRLGNTNLSANAKFDQRLIDSTQTIVTDWIYNYTRKILKWNGTTPENRSGRGWAFRLNDTVANNGLLSIYSDSTKKLLEIGKDTLQVYRPLVCSTDVIANRTVKGDSLVIKGGRVTASMTTDSSISKGSRITNNLTASRVIATDSIKTTNIIRTNKLIADSIQINGGAWIKNAAIGGFVMKLFNNDSTTDTVNNDSVNYYVFNNNASLALNFSKKPRYNNPKIFKYITNDFPSVVRPATMKTVQIPTTFVWGGGTALTLTIGNGIRSDFKILPAGACTLTVEYLLGPAPISASAGVTAYAEGISYSLN